MVEINTKATESLFIEVVIQRWCTKLGRARLARVICSMSAALSHDQKKRNVPNFQKWFDSIEVDENNVFKINSKIMKAFFFFVGENMDVFSENFIQQRVHGQVDTAPSSTVPQQIISQINFQEVPKMLHCRKERLKVRKNITLLQQYANQLFPCNGDQRLIFLFAAFELHPEFRELSPILNTTVEALALVSQVHSQLRTNNNPTSNLANYLESGPMQFLEQNEQEMGGEVVYHKFIHKHTCSVFHLPRNLLHVFLVVGNAMF